MKALKDQLAAGEQALEEAAALLAKADDMSAAGLEDDLDEDFADYDAAAEEGDAAAAEAEREAAELEAAEAAAEEDAGAFVDQDGLDGQPATDPEAVAAAAEEDEDEVEDADEDGPPVLAKAAGASADEGMEVADATPYLEALHESVTLLAKAVDGLEQRLEASEARRAALDRALVGGLQAQQETLGTLAKAQGAIANTPLRPKSQSVTVPTTEPAAPKAEIGELFVKAMEVVDATTAGKIEHYFNRGDRDGILNALTPAQRAQVGA